jgi:hypothetical protein
MIELKSCPLCGADARFSEVAALFGIECASAFCGVAVPAQHSTQAAAALIWNHRIYSGSDELPKLTERQEAYLEYIQDQIDKHHVPPTRQELADHFGTCLNAAVEMVNRLVSKGRLRVIRESSRGIRLVNL